MKTRNSKLQKTELNSLTSLIVLFAAALVLNYQANATEKTTHNNAGTEAYAEMVNAEIETAINIESWMLNGNNFYNHYELEAENETSLEMESWMTNATMFTVAYSLETEKEEALDVLEWMMNETNFLPVFSLETEMEEAMELENWMTNEASFSAEYSLEAETEVTLNVESWMLNEISFLPAIILEKETENMLELEEWMVKDSTFQKAAPDKTQSEALAMNAPEKQEKIKTIEYKDAVSGQTFLFRLAEIEEPKLELERWMVDRKYWIRK